MEIHRKDVGLILALDGMADSAYMTWARLMHGRVGGLKVNDGLDRPGPQVIGWLKNEGSEYAVFADAKYYDTDGTMKNRIRKLAAQGANSISVSGFMPMSSLQAAVEHRGAAEIWMVGILSSTTPEEFRTEINADFALMQSTLFARAVAAGVQGIICAPSDLPLAVDVLGKKRKLGQMKLVVPGTRSPGADHGQQKRVMTPAEAKAMGATHLVVGSQVTKHADPLMEIERIYGELGQIMPGGPLQAERRRPSTPPPTV